MESVHRPLGSIFFSDNGTSPLYQAEAAYGFLHPSLSEALTGGGIVQSSVGFFGGIINTNFE